jgi:hypothetical protein
MALVVILRLGLTYHMEIEERSDVPFLYSIEIIMFKRLGIKDSYVYR